MNIEKYTPTEAEHLRVVGREKAQEYRDPEKREAKEWQAPLWTIDKYVWDNFGRMK